MTLILGLGMATASFAGNVETTNTAEAEKAEAPKACAEVPTACGTRIACAADDQPEMLTQTIIMIYWEVATFGC
jgi:hypothetical protein